MKSIAFVSDDKEQLKKAEAFLALLGYTWPHQEKWSKPTIPDSAKAIWRESAYGGCIAWSNHLAISTGKQFTTLRSFMLAVIEDMPDEPEPIIWDGDPVLFHDDHVTLGSKQWVNIDNETILAIADRIREGQG